MAIYPGLVKSYANQIYIDGTRRFTARDGYQGVLPDYVSPTKQYAATGVINGALDSATFTGYTQAQIDNALDKTYINDQEYIDTMNYRV